MRDTAPGLGTFVRFDTATWNALRARASVTGHSPARTIVDLVRDALVNPTAPQGQETLRNGQNH